MASFALYYGKKIARLAFVRKTRKIIRKKASTEKNRDRKISLLCGRAGDLRPNSKASEKKVVSNFAIKISDPSLVLSLVRMCFRDIFVPNIKTLLINRVWFCFFFCRLSLPNLYLLDASHFSKSNLIIKIGSFLVVESILIIADQWRIFSSSYFINVQCFFY